MRAMLTPRSLMRHGAGALVFAVALPALASGREEDRARRVYDIFKKNCLECHGESRKGSLDLRTHETLIKGGASGRVVVPHEPQKSRLFLLVSHANPDDVMPFKRPKLADDDIETIRQWIEDGASLEAVEDAVLEEKRAPAALAKLEDRPIRPVIAPMPAHARKPLRNPIDAFLLAEMAKKGLTPAPAADRRTLIRRAYLDVLGLLP